VVTDEEGLPVVGAPVRVMEGEAPRLRFGHLDSTDSAGRYRLQFLRPGATRIRVEDQNFEAAQALVWVQSGEQRRDFTLLTRAGHRVAGQVLAGGRSPVAGVTVELQNRRTGWFYSGTTDGQGSFAISDVPDGEYVVSLVGSRLYVAAESRRLDVDGGAVEGFVVRAEEPCSVAGVLLGLAPTEARRAAVRAISGDRELPGLVDPSRQTFRFERLIAGTWELVGQVRGTDLRARRVLGSEPGSGELEVDLDFGAVTVEPEGVPHAP
jgi:hypothetical protein